MAESTAAWIAALRESVCRFGHRNWILIADGAYPCHSARGVTTVVADEDLPAVLERALALLNEARHVRPVPWLDTEMALVSEAAAPGIQAYRARLNTALAGYRVNQAPHSELIRRIGAAAAQFEVLVVKTQTMLPYASVFLELDCAYWDAAREEELRALLPKAI
ncbi:MAG: hypothetical protein HY320_12360 [Armatimonadetes bacterium]|nr:hypothetical protein [Armatimonadota bacterium]